MTLLIVGLMLVAIAMSALAYSLFSDPVARISKDRRTLSYVPREPLWRVVFHGFANGVDSVLKSRGWVPFRASELESADIKKPAGVVLSWIIIATVAAFGVGTIVGRSPVSGVLLAVLVPVFAKLVLRVRAGRRRKAFAKQLDNTLRIVASALRAGQSLAIALNSVASDSGAPMSEEITRVVNENRLGRDLVEAMTAAAVRMQNDDFMWFAEAVEVQRDAGGNLNDIIDTVAETIRDRAEIREKINANAAEGKASAYVLMGLPIALAVAYTIMNPGYMDPLISTSGGNFLLALSVILYGISWFWMRAIVSIKV